MSRPICWVCKEREAGTSVTRPGGIAVGWCDECAEEIFREAFEREDDYEHPDL